MAMLHGLRGGMGSTADVQALITQTAAAYGVPPALALAVAKQESGYNQAARGSSGEIGVFQLMPGTAAGLGVDPSDLTQNVQGGIRYLSQMLAKYGDPSRALAAYNAGPGNVDAGRIPSSTRAYVSNILSMANLVPADLTVTGTPIYTASTLPAKADPYTYTTQDPDPETIAPVDAGDDTGLYLALAAAGAVAFAFLH